MKQLIFFLLCISSIFSQELEVKIKKIEVLIFLKTASVFEGFISESFFDVYQQLGVTPKKITLPTDFQFWENAFTHDFIRIKLAQVERIEKVFRPQENKSELIEKMIPVEEKTEIPVEKIEVPKPLPEKKWTPVVTPEQQKEYERILEQFPPTEYHWKKMLHTLKLQWHYGILLKTQQREFLRQYPQWHIAFLYQNQRQPLQEIQENREEKAKEILARFPKDLSSWEVEIEKLTQQLNNQEPFLPEMFEGLEQFPQWIEATLLN